jgi:hypothetical protein
LLPVPRQEARRSLQRCSLATSSVIYFKLNVEMESAAPDCKVVWRREKQIGVEFR